MHVISHIGHMYEYEHMRQNMRQNMSAKDYAALTRCPHSSAGITSMLMYMDDCIF